MYLHESHARSKYSGSIFDEMQMRCAEETQVFHHSLMNHTVNPNYHPGQWKYGAPQHLGQGSHGAASTHFAGPSLL